MYYKLNPKQITIILELKNKCDELDLWNISFSEYFPERVNFNITKYKTYWELEVKTDNNTKIDIYEIKSNLLDAVGELQSCIMD